MRRADLSQAECSIAQALSIVGDWWTLLIVRDIVGGINRFDELQAELGISRKVLAERLALLVERDVLERRLYQSRPPRYEYHLTAGGRGLVPVLVALQDWGSRFVAGDGAVTATSSARSHETRRVRRLVGSRIPPLSLVSSDGRRSDPIGEDDWTVLFCYPGAFAAPESYPPNWSEIPGAAGCTLECSAYRDHLTEFAARGAGVAGVSVQHPGEQEAFRTKARLNYPLFSDQDLDLTAALRLPTFRAAGRDRLKRLTLVVGGDRTIRHVLYPIADPADSVENVLGLLDTKLEAQIR